MRTLVTGASGFLGRAIVKRLLAEGHQVRAVCRGAAPELEALGVEVHRADLRDRQAAIAACRGVDVVFHTAGVAGIWGPWKHYFDSNVAATMHVVAGCQEHGVGRLVFTSSPSVVFDGSDQEGLDESAPFPSRWLCHYPRSKALAERHVLESNGARGLLTCALRPHLVWGPGDRHLVPGLIARRRANRLWRVGEGGNRIDMIYIDNAAEAHWLAAQALAPGSPAAGRAYFLSQGEPVNCWEWINEILALANLPPPTRQISLKAAWRLGAAMEIFSRIAPFAGEPSLTRFLAAQLGRSHYYDISAARRDLGYHPRVSTEEGMRRLAETLASSPPT
jgi:nucleoside-diphosphate-sugar epimerase